MKKLFLLIFFIFTLLLAEIISFAENKIYTDPEAEIQWFFTKS